MQISFSRSVKKLRSTTWNVKYNWSILALHCQSVNRGHSIVKVENSREKIKFPFSFSLQCLTRGRNFNLEFHTVTALILAISSNAWIFNMNQVTRELNWFKDNTVWFIIVQHQMHRLCRINPMEYLIGVKCEWSERLMRFDVAEI